MISSRLPFAGDVLGRGLDAVRDPSTPSRRPASLDSIAPGGRRGREMRDKLSALARREATIGGNQHGHCEHDRAGKKSALDPIHPVVVNQHDGWQALAHDLFVRCLLYTSP